MFLRKTLKRIANLEKYCERLSERITAVDTSDPMEFLYDKYYEMRRYAVDLARDVIKKGKHLETKSTYGFLPTVIKRFKYKEHEVTLKHAPEQAMYYVETEDISFHGRDAEELWDFAEQCHDRKEVL